MTVNLRILVPEETTNYILNPQLRYDTTGWTAYSSAISRSLDYTRFGVASLKVVTNGSALNEGAYFRVSALQGVTDIVTVSAYVRGSGKIRIRVIDYSASGREYYSQPINLTNNFWQRITITGALTGTAAGNDVRLYVETADSTAKAITFYVDGAQMERKAYATSYCDGDQPGCRWNVINSASASTRTADTRAGGRWVALVGPMRGDDDLYVTQLTGGGVAPISSQNQAFALAPGSFNQGYKVNNRVTTFVFNAKNPNLDTNNVSLRRLHELRQQLIDIIKPDKTVGDESFLLEYSDDAADRALYCNFRYEAGLEGDWDIRNGWYNSFPVRFMATDPFWYEDSQNVQQLGTKNSVTGINQHILWANIQGKWVDFGYTATIVYDFAESPDGTIYITTSSGMYKWDGTNLTLITTGIGVLDVAPDGTVYVATATGVSKYVPSTGVFTALGGAFNGSVSAICVAQNGEVYVGGGFTTIGGVSFARIARWDGGQWRTVGATSGMNGNVNAIIRGNDNNTLYIAGGFTASNGGSIAYGYVASVNLTTNLFSQLGYGLNNTVYALALGRDGTLYAGGAFTAAGSPATTSMSQVAQWNGGNLWRALGNGLTSSVGGSGSYVRSLTIGKNGELYAAGGFNLSGSQTMYKLAKWFSSTWSPMELNIISGLTATGQAGINSILATKKGDLFIGAEQATSVPPVEYPYYNTVNNSATAALYPIMYIKGVGTVRFIGNTKTGEGLYLNLPILSGEEVFIDFARGMITSTARGNLISGILPGSEIRALNLLPGDNGIGVFITDDFQCIAQIQYQPVHWSVDAIVNAGAL